MADSDVKSKRITATGSLAVGPARIRQIQLKTAAGSPRLTITDGSGGQPFWIWILTHLIRTQ